LTQGDILIESIFIPVELDEYEKRVTQLVKVLLELSTTTQTNSDINLVSFAEAA